MKKGNIAVAVAALLVSFGASAANNEGYLTDTRGQIVKSGAGLCWHTGYWTPAMAVEGCDPVASKRTDAPHEPIGPKPMAEKKELRSDVLFAFDKATLTNIGKVELDLIAKEILRLKAVNFVLVIGHADRLGNASYNLALSKKRAAAVRNYLISKGVPASVVRSDGMGETQPLSKPNECVGKGSKLIACLAKDRRVEIQIVGSN